MSTQEIQEVLAKRYGAGFVTDIEQDTRRPVSTRIVVRFISAKKGEPEWLLDWRLKAFRHWPTMKEPTWAKVSYPPIDYQAISYYSAPKSKATRRSASTRSIRSCSRPTRSSASRSHERAALAGRRGRRGLRQRVGRHDVQGQARRGRAIIFCSISEAVQRASGAGPEVPRQRRADHRQLLRDAELRRLHRRFVRLRARRACAARWSSRPTSASTRRSTGQFERTLIIADDGSLRELPRGLHRADARREPAARGGRRARRARRRRDQVLDGPELVSRATKKGRGGIYNFVTKRGKCAGARSKISLDAGRDRLGDHLEVPELHPRGRRLGRRVLLGRAHEQPPAGRHRHEDDPPRQEHAQRRSSRRGSAPATARTRTAASCASRKHADGARNYTQCDSLLIGAHVRRAHGPVHRRAQRHRPRSSTRRRRRASARTSSSTAGSAASREEDAVSLIVNGFCKEVLKELPMEFAVEAQKLLGVSLEGAVG